MKLVKKIFPMGVIVFLFLVDPAFAHMCHDPFRPEDHLVLMPEKDLIRIEEIGEFRMYAENTFRSTLQEVRLRVESPAFDIDIEPPLLERLVPGERAFFLVKLKLRKGFEPGDYPLRISVEAKSAEIKPSIERMEVVVDRGVGSPEEVVGHLKEEVEEAPKKAGEVMVKVEKIPHWKKTYFYIVFILLLLGMLIWRKIK